MRLADLDLPADKNIKIQASEIASEVLTFFNGKEEGQLKEEDLEEVVV
jgi:hypothetical protein